ncbi:MAG: HEPN domain-containing protein [Candidatus Nitrosotenuis sp.]
MGNLTNEIQEYEITFLLDERFPSNYGEITVPEIRIAVDKQDIKKSWATIRIKSNSSTNAISSARMKLDIFLGLYFLYSLNPKRINDNHGVTVNNLSTNQVSSELRAFVVTRGREDLDIFNQITSEYMELTQRENNEYIKIAMDYFRLGMMEYRKENSIIDFFIALEALFSKEGPKIEHSISNRVATLLGMDVNHRKGILRKVRELYSIRSKIVHGSKTEINEVDRLQLVRWVRESILRFLVLSNHYQNRDEIIRLIDDSALENSIRIELIKKSNILLPKVVRF